MSRALEQNRPFLKVDLQGDALLLGQRGDQRNQIAQHLVQIEALLYFVRRQGQRQEGGQRTVQPASSSLNTFR